MPQAKVRTALKPAALTELAPIVEATFDRLKAVGEVDDSWTFDLSSVDRLSKSELHERSAVAATTLRKLQALYVQVAEPTRSLPVIRLLAEILDVLEVFSAVDETLRSDAIPHFHAAMASIWNVCGGEDVMLE